MAGVVFKSGVSAIKVIIEENSLQEATCLKFKNRNFFSVWHTMGKDKDKQLYKNQPNIQVTLAINIEAETPT